MRGKDRSISTPGFRPGIKKVTRQEQHLVYGIDDFFKDLLKVMDIAEIRELTKFNAREFRIIMDGDKAAIQKFLTVGKCQELSKTFNLRPNYFYELWQMLEYDAKYLSTPAAKKAMKIDHKKIDRHCQGIMEQLFA